MADNQEPELTWIDKANRPKLELDQCDVGGLPGDAGDKNMNE